MRPITFNWFVEVVEQASLFFECANIQSGRSTCSFLISSQVWALGKLMHSFVPTILHVVCHPAMFLTTPWLFRGQQQVLMDYLSYSQLKQHVSMIIMRMVCFDFPWIICVQIDRDQEKCVFNFSHCFICVYGFFEWPQRFGKCWFIT